MLNRKFFEKEYVVYFNKIYFNSDHIFQRNETRKLVKIIETKIITCTHFRKILGYT